MSETKKWLTGHNLIALSSGALVIYVITVFLIDSRIKEIELSNRVLISDQRALLVLIAETTARNGADEVTESIVKDCTVNDRIKFDDSLDRLNGGLLHAELVELERLFGRCGSFSSDRKSVMVARMAREIEIYQNYVDQLTMVVKEDQSTEFAVDTWQALVAEETKQSELFNRLVSLQDKIITALLVGKTVDSPEIKAILGEVNEVQENLVVVSRQAVAIRSSLISL